MLKLFAKYSLGSVLSALISLFTTPIITALIIPEEMGKASMFTLAINFLLQIVLLGTDQSYVREFYKSKTPFQQQELLFNCLVPSVVFCAIICSGLYIGRESVARLLVDDGGNFVVVLLCVSILVGLVERFAMVMLRLEKKALAFSLIRFLAALTNFAVIYYYACYEQRNFYAILYGNLAGMLLTIVLAVVLMKRKWQPIAFSWRGIKRVLAYGLPFVPAFIAGWVFEGVDKIALRRFADFNELGLFSAAFKFVSILSILQLAFTTFWAPMSMELYESDSIEAQHKFSKVFSLAAGTLVLGSLGLIFCKDLVLLLFDKQYDKSGNIMPFLLFIPVMYTLSEITVGGINFKRKTYWHLLIAVISGLVNFGLCFWLVPTYGARGAATSTGFSYILFFYLRTFISQRYFKVFIDQKRLAISLVLLVAVSYLTTFEVASKSLLFVINGAVCVVVFVLYRGIFFDNFFALFKKKGLNNQ